MKKIVIRNYIAWEGRKVIEFTAEPAQLLSRTHVCDLSVSLTDQEYFDLRKGIGRDLILQELIHTMKGLIAGLEEELKDLNKK